MFTDPFLLEDIRKMFGQDLDDEIVRKAFKIFGGIIYRDRQEREIIGCYNHKDYTMVILSGKDVEYVFIKRLFAKEFSKKELLEAIIKNSRFDFLDSVFGGNHLIKITNGIYIDSKIKDVGVIYETKDFILDHYNNFISCP